MVHRHVPVPLVACLLVSGLIRAQDNTQDHAGDVINLIPADALGCIIIKHLSKTDEKLQAVGERMQLPLPSMVAMGKLQSGITRGVNEDGTYAVAALPAAQGPALVFVIPVSDYAAFVEQLEPEGTEDGITSGRLMNRPTIACEKAGHAIVTSANNRRVLQKLLSDDVAGIREPDHVKVLNSDHDIVMLLPSGGVRVLVELGKRGLAEAKTVMEAQFDQPNPAVAGLQAYVQFLDAVSSEATAAAAGLKIEAEGSLRLNEWVWISPKGRIAPLLRDIKPLDGDLLWGLPRTPYVAAVGGVIPNGVMTPMMDFSRNLMKGMPQLYGLTPEQVDDMMDLSLKYLPDMRAMSLFVGTGQQDGPVYREMLVVMQVADAPSYVANYRKYWSELDEVLGEAEGSFLKGVRVEDVKMDDVSVLKVTMPLPGLQGLNALNQAEIDALMEKLYGPEGITMYLAAGDEHTVLIAYTGKAILREAFQAISDESNQFLQNSNTAATSAQLPADAHMVGFWSPSGTAVFVNRTIQLLSGDEVGRQLPDFPDSPPVGWSVKAQPSVVEFQTLVPAETVETVGTYIEKVRQLRESR